MQHTGIVNVDIGYAKAQEQVKSQKQQLCG